MTSIDPHERELSSADALSAAFSFFRDFDRRVANQRVVESHVAQSVKPAGVAATVNPSETAVKAS